MFLNLIENINVEKTKVTIEYKEKNEQVNKLIDYIEHLEEVENCFIASADGRIYSISINDILYIESVDRKTFGYTVDEVCFSDRPFIVIECGTYDELMKNIMEDADPFPFDLSEDELLNEVKCSLGIEPYPKDY